jgi:hypothetical protein
LEGIAERQQQIDYIFELIAQNGLRFVIGSEAVICGATAKEFMDWMAGDNRYYHVTIEVSAEKDPTNEGEFVYSMLCRQRKDE